jgi:sugar phosphate isomerase/epimerase
VWDIVQRVDRPNIGLCLDTFQTAGGEWGDPTTKSGKIETMTAEELDHKFKTSLELLTAKVPPEKIFFLQISDAYKMDPPLDKELDERGLRPRGRWSHDYRPLPYDGGYLPVVEVTKAVLGTGFRGWCSIEVFDSQGPKKYPDDMEPYAKKAMSSLERLLEEAGL